LISAGIEPSARAESISPEQFIRLSEVHGGRDTQNL